MVTASGRGVEKRKQLEGEPMRDSKRRQEGRLPAPWVHVFTVDARSPVIPRRLVFCESKRGVEGDEIASIDRVVF